MSLIIASKHENIKIKEAIVIERSANGWLSNFVNIPKTNIPSPKNTIIKMCHHFNFGLSFISSSSSIIV